MPTDLLQINLIAIDEMSFMTTHSAFDSNSRTIPQKNTSSNGKQIVIQTNSSTYLRSKFAKMRGRKKNRSSNINYDSHKGVVLVNKESHNVHFGSSFETLEDILLTDK